MTATWHEVWGQKLWQEYLGLLKGFAAGITEWLSARFPHRIISVSPLTSSRLNSVLHVSNHKIITIPNGIDAAAIEATPPQIKQYDLIFVGRLLAHKNADLVIRVVEYLKRTRPNVSCLLIGEGPEDKRLHDLAAELQLESNITFRGSLPTEEIYRSYKASKICLLPSSREGFGIVTLEANAAGLPVITIDAQDNAMKDIIVEGENGFVRPADVETIAQVIQELLSDERRLTAMEHSCRNTAHQYNWDNISRQVEALYQSIIARI
jgi:glycosyltransferase involved in cell wall biosynthesis